MTRATPVRIAILLSCPNFEDWYGRTFNLDLQGYLSDYRSDYSWYYLKMFRDSGYTPIIYIPSLTYSGLRSTEDGYQVRFIPIQRHLRFFGRSHYVPTKYGRYVTGVLNAFSFLSPLKAAVEEDQLGVLYVQEYWHARFDVLVSALSRRLKIVAADHGGIYRQNWLGFKRKTLPKAFALTSLSEEESRNVQSFGVKSCVLPNPVDTSFFSAPTSGPLRVADRGKTVVTVARLNNHHKLTSDLIEALGKLDHSWRLIIVGDGPDRGMLEKLAQDRQVDSRVEFLGFIKDRERIRELYLDSDVFCLPSANEGLAMAALEAMSCGLPVVLTPAPAFQDLIQSGVNGILTPVGDVEQLAASIDSGYRNREAMGAAARETILSKYSVRTFMEKFDQLIHSPGEPC